MTLLYKNDNFYTTKKRRADKGKAKKKPPRLNTNMDQAMTDIINEISRRTLRDWNAWTVNNSQIYTVNTRE